MRLTCPNCDARYEVPDEVIPVEGRDVQCSNCGQTWFQHHPDHEPPEDDEGAVSLPDTPDPDEEVAPPPQPSAPPQPTQRKLDPAVADILREEAEAEFEARRKREAEALESQPELGLDTADAPPAPARSRPEPDAGREAEQRSLEARKRMARMRGEPEPESEAAAAAAAVSSRRQLLPDIEEINSTLRSDNPPSGVDPLAREELGAGGGPKQKRGFRRGFLTMIVIAVALLLVYLYAPEIAQSVPALDPVLNSYVVAVDQIRLSLNAQGARLVDWLNSAATATPDS